MEWRRGPTTATSNSSQAKAPSASSTTATTTTFTAGDPKSSFNDSFESDHGYESPSRGAKTKGAGVLLTGQLDEAREHEVICTVGCEKLSI